MNRQKLPNITIISLFGEINNSNSRAHKIKNAFSTSSVFVTSDFSHGLKKYKSKSNEQPEAFTKSVYLPVPSYTKNISLRRLYSHIIFAFKLRYYLINLVEKPDIVICLMPTSSAAYIAGKYCSKNNIMFVVDVIDIWPESLIPLYRNKGILNMLLSPWNSLTKKAYEFADYISGESQDYAYKAHLINQAVPWSYTYLGVDKLRTKALIAESELQIKRSKKTLNLCYGGSLGNSYDFDNILNALKLVNEAGVKFKMYFVGEGEKRDNIEKFANEHKLNIQVTGRLNYSDYLKYLSICDIGFNSFLSDTKVVHSYKFNDYCACGLFVVNNLEGETANMIEKYDIGVNYKNTDLANKLLEICLNWEIHKDKNMSMDRLIKTELDTQYIYETMKYNILTAYKNFNS